MSESAKQELKADPGTGSTPMDLDDVADTAHFATLYPVPRFSAGSGTRLNVHYGLNKFGVEVGSRAFREMWMRPAPLGPEQRKAMLQSMGYMPTIAHQIEDLTPNSPYSDVKKALERAGIRLQSTPKGGLERTVRHHVVTDWTKGVLSTMGNLRNSLLDLVREQITLKMKEAGDGKPDSAILRLVNNLAENHLFSPVSDSGTCPPRLPPKDNFSISLCNGQYEIPFNELMRARTKARLMHNRRGSYVTCVVPRKPSEPLKTAFWTMITAALEKAKDTQTGSSVNLTETLRRAQSSPQFVDEVKQKKSLCELLDFIKKYYESGTSMRIAGDADAASTPASSSMPTATEAMCGARGSKRSMPEPMARKRVAIAASTAVPPAAGSVNPALSRVDDAESGEADAQADNEQQQADSVSVASQGSQASQASQGSQGSQSSAISNWTTNTARTRGTKLSIPVDQAVQILVRVEQVLPEGATPEERTLIVEAAGKIARLSGAVPHRFNSDQETEKMLDEVVALVRRYCEISKRDVRNVCELLQQLYSPDEEMVRLREEQAPRIASAKAKAKTQEEEKKKAEQAQAQAQAQA